MTRSNISAANTPGDIFPRYQLTVVSSFGSGTIDLDVLFNEDPVTGDITALESDFFPAMITALEGVSGVSSVTLFKMAETVTNITP